MIESTTNGKLFDSEEVKRAIGLIAEPGEVFELRLLNASMSSDRSWTRTYSGYFNDPAKAVSALGTMVNASGCYITLNPTDSSLLARANNRLKRAGTGDSTKDKEITRRRRLLIDFDADRATGISATSSEKHAAKKMSESVDLFLHDLGWPDSIIGDSGNGIHLIYGIDLPIDDNGLIENCLKALDQKFSNSEVKIDTSVHNSSRISKLYGTLVCKGDHTTDRPHRMSRILEAPETLQVVSQALLEELAAMLQVDTPASGSGHHSTNGHRQTFDLVAFITKHGLDVSGPEPYEGGQCWEFRTSPMCGHGGDGTWLIQFSNGALSAGCHHDSCTWGWKDLRQKFEPKQYAGGSDFNYSKPYHPQQQAESDRPRVEKFCFSELAEKYPKLKPSVVHGLFRAGETVNLISVSKIGKSWLAYLLALCIIMGRLWLDTFETVSGNVLLIDLELHHETLVHRIPKVAEKLGMFPDDYGSQLDIWPLRGNLRNLYELAEDFEAIEYGKYQIIIIDAKYRVLPPGTSENDNANEAALYNRLDQYAAQTGAAIVLIHHSTKGSQSEKRVTDVGAGAGSQSRAADCHLILREHEEDDTVVLDAAVRSFPPVEPIVLRWEYPLWVRDEFGDPQQLKGSQNKKDEKQAQEDKEGMEQIAVVLDKDGPALASVIRLRSGLGRTRAERLLGIMTQGGQIEATEIDYRGNKTNEYNLPKSSD